MKKIKLNTEKLQLRKEKIANLTNQDMRKLYGGDDPMTTSTTIQMPICDTDQSTGCNVKSSGYCPSTNYGTSDQTCYTGPTPDTVTFCTPQTSNGC